MAEKNAGRLCSAPAVTPDELVYSHGPAMWLDEWKPETILNKLNRKITTGRELPVGFLIKPLGLFIADDKNQAVFLRDVIKTYLSVRSFAERFGGIHPLNKQQRESTTEAESSNVDGYLKNRIALVTGAGSGLGRSISVGLARAGAAVGLLDIDSKTAEETSALIKKELPDSLTMAIGCDVTSESDIDAAFEALLKNWGGLDILVNAAGVAPAAPLVDMAVDKWRFALEVNLTGYFLMARAAARIMIRQGIGGSIINISFKSGLDASKNNTAYNTTKAGELHMARGWALELGEYGIRVNCICPGNVFEGSKIWNRQYIKECAKKRGIKPEEVIPYYISKTSLKREIKGQDIADAVVFLCSDKACTITGQILVADAGQVMVR
ncbi:3-phenylpropionate-dihydrodiol/cinnamic acid-dihydrodiol dehydrogenase [subsurface metagenome]